MQGKEKRLATWGNLQLDTVVERWEGLSNELFFGGLLSQVHLKSRKMFDLRGRRKHSESR